MRSPTTDRLSLCCALAFTQSHLLNPGHFSRVSFFSDGLSDESSEPLGRDLTRSARFQPQATPVAEWAYRGPIDWGRHRVKPPEGALSGRRSPRVLLYNWRFESVRMRRLPETRFSAALRCGRRLDSDAADDCERRHRSSASERQNKPKSHFESVREILLLSRVSSSSSSSPSPPTPPPPSSPLPPPSSSALSI